MDLSSISLSSSLLKLSVLVAICACSWCMNTNPVLLSHTEAPFPLWEQGPGGSDHCPFTDYMLPRKDLTGGSEGQSVVCTLVSAGVSFRAASSHLRNTWGFGGKPGEGWAWRQERPYVFQSCGCLSGVSSRSDCTIGCLGVQDLEGKGSRPRKTALLSCMGSTVWVTSVTPFCSITKAHNCESDFLLLFTVAKLVYIFS